MLESFDQSPDVVLFLGARIGYFSSDMLVGKK